MGMLFLIYDPVAGLYLTAIDADGELAWGAKGGAMLVPDAAADAMLARPDGEGWLREYAGVARNVGMGHVKRRRRRRAA